MILTQLSATRAEVVLAAGEASDTEGGADGGFDELFELEWDSESPLTFKLAPFAASRAVSIPKHFERVDAYLSFDDFMVKAVSAPLWVVPGGSQEAVVRGSEDATLPSWSSSLRSLTDNI